MFEVISISRGATSATDGRATVIRSVLRAAPPPDDPAGGTHPQPAIHPIVAAGVRALTRTER
ncbi:hypothetical protein V6V47_16245 [Micromonospora sp. CPCC 205539]|uniref:hypothetical protein n=1 Tax=Micromonospora sp. CPCC 205539 TaxID=3122408 RepID=UPI002FEFB327